MSQLTSTDYSKIFPLISGIKKVANEFEGEDKKIVLEFLIRDALGKTTQEIVKESHQISVSNPTQNKSEPENSNLPITISSALEIENRTKLHLSKLDTKQIDAFLKRQNVSSDLIEKLFFHNGERIERLYASLNVTKKVEAQVRVALLRCLSNAIQNGVLSATMEDIRNECKEFGVLDTNLSKNLKTRQQLFGTLDESKVQLNAEGERELASLINELTGQEA